MASLRNTIIVLVLAMLSVVTFSRNGIWREPVTLWSDVLVKSPQNGKVHYNLGVSLAQQERFAAAEIHLIKALALSPDHKTHNNLGSIYFLQGRMLEAERHFQFALRYSPTSPEVRYNLGLLCLHQERYDAAEQHFEDVVILDPAFPEAWTGLALIARRYGRFAEAARYDKQALRSTSEKQ